MKIPPPGIGFRGLTEEDEGEEAGRRLREYNVIMSELRRTHEFATTAALHQMALQRVVVGQGKTQQANVDGTNNKSHKFDRNRRRTTMNKSNPNLLLSSLNGSLAQLRFSEGGDDVGLDDDVEEREMTCRGNLGRSKSLGWQQSSTNEVQLGSEAQIHHNDLNGGGGGGHGMGGGGGRNGAGVGKMLGFIRKAVQTNMAKDLVDLRRPSGMSELDTSLSSRGAAAIREEHKSAMDDVRASIEFYRRRSNEGAAGVENAVARSGGGGGRRGTMLHSNNHNNNGGGRHQGAMLRNSSIGIGGVTTNDAPLASVGSSSEPVCILMARDSSCDLVNAGRIEALKKACAEADGESGSGGGGMRRVVSIIELENVDNQEEELQDDWNKEAAEKEGAATSGRHNNKEDKRATHRQQGRKQRRRRSSVKSAAGMNNVASLANILELDELAPGHLVRAATDPTTTTTRDDKKILVCTWRTQSKLPAKDMLRTASSNELSVLSAARTTNEGECVDGPNPTRPRLQQTTGTLICEFDDDDDGLAPTQLHRSGSFANASIATSSSKSSSCADGNGGLICNFGGSSSRRRGSASSSTGRGMSRVVSKITLSSICELRGEGERHFFEGDDDAGEKENVTNSIEEEKDEGGGRGKTSPSRRSRRRSSSTISVGGVPRLRSVLSVESIRYETGQDNDYGNNDKSDDNVQAVAPEDYFFIKRRRMSELTLDDSLGEGSAVGLDMGF